MINKFSAKTQNFAKIFFSALILFSLTNQIAHAQYVCQTAPNPIVINGSINVGDVSQAGRISRDGRPSTCGESGGATLENNDTVRRDAHNFTNPFSETVCVQVEIDFTGCGGAQTQAVAYSSYNPAQPAASVIGDSGFSTINKGTFSFPVGPNSSFTVVIHDIAEGGNPEQMCPAYSFKVSYLRNCRQSGFDRTNDGRADITVYRPSSVSGWYSLDSETNQLVAREFGTVGDIVTGGSDYDGDGKTDLSVYRPSINSWIYGADQNAPGQNFQVVQWGATGDVRVPGDYDGDGKNDIAVFRPSNGTWYVLRSSDNALLSRQWGQANDIPISSDFDGDLKTDFAVVRPTSGGLVWYLLKSNYNYGFDDSEFWGLPTDKLVPADYDGDGKTDLAVWRPSDGTFYVRRSSNNTLQAVKWGLEGDVPQPADYDGDKKHDFAVFRRSATPGQTFWYILNSGTNTIRAVQWGQQNDQPISSPYRIQ